VTTKNSNSQSAVSPARAAAFDILLRVERESSYASELLHSRTYDRLTPVDHSLTTELVMGVLRWRSLLDSQISEVSSQPLSRSIPKSLPHCGSRFTSSAGSVAFQRAQLLMKAWNSSSAPANAPLPPSSMPFCANLLPASSAAVILLRHHHRGLR